MKVHSGMSNSLWPQRLYSLPGSSVHGILQARILEWVAIPFSMGSSQPSDWTWVKPEPTSQADFVTIWATREAQRRLRAEEMMLSNCGPGEDSWESLGEQGDQSCPSSRKSTPKYSLEGLMLNLNLQSFGRLMPRADSLEKTLLLGKIEGRRRRGQQRMRWWIASLTHWTQV